MPESHSDKLSRLRQMLGDDGTWDLSPNDKAAIRHVLGMVNLMADELAGYTGRTVPFEETRIGELVEKGE